MRGLAFAVVLLVGCLARNAGPIDDPSPVGDPSLGDPSPTRCRNGLGCDGGELCTRDGQCLPPDQVRAVHVAWTLRGAPASPTSCAPAPDLLITLSSTTRGGSVTFSPVPCVEGKFSVDRLPTWFDHVRLGRSYSDSQGAAIDGDGNAMLDLPY